MRLDPLSEIQRATTRALLLSSAAWCVLATCASAQSESQYSIRVESDLVVVPIMVQEKAIGPQPLSEWIDGEGHKDVTGLTATDFHLLEDGVERAIQNVAVEPWRTRWIRDSTDCHVEDFSHWGVKWTMGLSAYLQCPSTSIGEIAYLVAYKPSPSPSGSCHKIAVTVDHRDVLVFHRKEYCNVPDSDYDPLERTPLGQKMESGLAAEDTREFDLPLQAGFFYTGGQTARVHIALDLPGTTIRKKWVDGRLWGRFAILGMVYGRDGSLAQRFSENYRYYFPSPTGGEAGRLAESDPRLAAYFPNRYEKRIDLSPGEYHLRVAFSDGTGFGCTETVLRVDPYDRKELGLSSVFLANRYQSAFSRPEAVFFGPSSRPFVPLVSRDIEVTPSGNTKFKRGEILIAYFEVYVPVASASPQPKVVVHLRIVEAKTGQVREVLEPLETATYSNPASPLIPIAEKIPTKKITKGSYRLEVQATDSAGRSTVWRPASFTIEEPKF
jgi:hypothetical protein